MLRCAFLHYLKFSRCINVSCSHKLCFKQLNPYIKVNIFLVCQNENNSIFKLSLFFIHSIFMCSKDTNMDWTTARSSTCLKSSPMEFMLVFVSMCAYIPMLDYK